MNFHMLHFYDGSVVAVDGCNAGNEDGGGGGDGG